MTAYRVPVVEVTAAGSRTETAVTVHADTPVQAWAAAQQLPGMPAPSASCGYGTPVCTTTGGGL